MIWRRFGSIAAAGLVATALITSPEMTPVIAAPQARSDNGAAVGKAKPPLPFESIGPIDTLIAAQAIRLDAIIVTRNVREFFGLDSSLFGGEPEEWWTGVRGGLFPHFESRVIEVPERPARILYVEGEPRWEYKFMRRALEDDPSVRLYDVMLAETDPDLVFFEMDIYWAFVGQHIAAGFEPADYVKANPQRYPLFHAKDGERRPDRTDGYDFTEFGAGDIDFAKFYREIGPNSRMHFSLWEQDNAPSTPAELGGSLGAAERSYDAMYNLRG